jgi:Arylsulfotransferase (ASST)
MNHADTAHFAAVLGALGAVLVLIPRQRLAVLAGFALLVAAEIGLALAGSGGLHLGRLASPGVHFAWQHNPLPAGENTIRLFDNESNGSNTVSPPTRVIWIHLDTAAATATLVRAISHPAGILVTSQGNAQALDTGNTFVGWGDRGRVSEFDPQGNLLFDAVLTKTADTYRAYRSVWSGQPDTQPTATARTNRNGTTTVHAIWNGATQVASWRVLAGSAANKLRPVRTAPWNGLDTTLTIKGIPSQVKVVALDPNGAVIGTSKPVVAG